jgi:hypothetical protein
MHWENEKNSSGAENDDDGLPGLLRQELWLRVLFSACDDDHEMSGAKKKKDASKKRPLE